MDKTSKLLPIAEYLMERRNSNGVCLIDKFRLYHLVNGWISSQFILVSALENRSSKRAFLGVWQVHKKPQNLTVPVNPGNKGIPYSPKIT